jgi:hypothetical protein
MNSFFGFCFDDDDDDDDVQYIYCSSGNWKQQQLVLVLQVFCIHHHPQFVGSETIIQFAPKGVRKLVTRLGRVFCKTARH